MKEGQKMNKKLILASQSPRRRELIGLLGMPFQAIGPNIQEALDQSLDIEKRIEKLALQKAENVFENNQDTIVIGSDTVVVLDNQILGKPIDENDAILMLRKLSGKVHEVITGVAILSAKNRVNYSIKTRVTFNVLTDKEIEEYVASKEPMDKAGSYAIQGKGSLFINKIDGDYYSVMGLPISRIYQNLTKLDW